MTGIPVTARRVLLVVVAAVLAAFGGCILSDQVTTLTIRGDGSADWVRFLSNIRSTEAGEKGERELRQFIEDFDARRDDEMRRIIRAGGEIVEARWLRREKPLANVVVARLPDAASLERFGTMTDEQGTEVVRTRFTKKDSRRRLAFVVAVTDNLRPSEPGHSTIRAFRQDQADSIGETRVAVVGGRIVDARGFTVARDRRSALLEPVEIRELLRDAGESLELFLEWEIDAE